MKGKQTHPGTTGSRSNGSGGEGSSAAGVTARASLPEGGPAGGDPQRPELILQAISDAIIQIDRQGRVVFANAAADSLWGRASARATATTMDALTAPIEMFDEEGRRLAVDQLPWSQAALARPADKLVRFRRGGSEDRWIQIQSTPLGGTPQEAPYTIHIFRDVTAPHRAARRERFLGEASALLSEHLDAPRMLQSMADHVVRSQADLCVVDMRVSGGGVSRVATAHRDPDKRQIALQIAECFPAEAEARAGAGVGVASVLGRGEPAFYPVLTDEQVGALAADPQHRQLFDSLRLRSMICVPLLVRGQTIGVVTFATGEASPPLTADDVTLAAELARRASLVLDNARLYAEAQDVLRSREDLLAIVSHDLRNPLGVVLTSCALLLRAALPTDKGDRARRQVEAIQRAANRMNRLIRDLLDLASIQGGQLVLTYRTHDAGSLLSESVASLQPMAVQKSQRLLAEVPADALTVSCDRERMIQVFANVIGNAIKFSAEGASIRATVVPDGDAVCFTVSDDGPGMTPEELRNMYDRAWQAKRKNRDGIGLGLSIVKGIVERHGGSIWAESTVGAGTTVHFRIPCEAPPAPAAV